MADTCQNAPLCQLAGSVRLCMLAVQLLLSWKPNGTELFLLLWLSKCNEPSVYLKMQHTLHKEFLLCILPHPMCQTKVPISLTQANIKERGLEGGIGGAA